MAEEKQVLDIAEQEAIGKALVLALQENPTIKAKKIKVYFERLDYGCLGLFTQQGTVYLRQFISGGFIAQYNFFLRYRRKQSTDEQKVEAETMMDALGEWLESGIEFPGLTDKRSIERITRTSHGFVAEMAQNGDVDFQIYLTLEYRRLA